MQRHGQESDGQGIGEHQLPNRHKGLRTCGTVCPSWKLLVAVNEGRVGDRHGRAPANAVGGAPPPPLRMHTALTPFPEQCAYIMRCFGADFDHKPTPEVRCGNPEETVGAWFLEYFADIEAGAVQHHLEARQDQAVHPYRVLRRLQDAGSPPPPTCHRIWP